jgi:hypothetical protein
MKKLILTTLTTAIAFGVFAQGSITGVQGMFSNDGITTPGANSGNPSLAAGGLYYTGNINLQLWYASTASVNAGQIATLNAFNNSNGSAGSGASAFALMQADGFTLASTTTLGGSTAGSLAYAVSSGGFTVADPNTIGLTGVPTSTVAWIAMYAVGSGGAFNNYSGVLAFSQNTGGNPTTTPAGIAAPMASDPAGLNLVLAAPAAVPEPATLTLAGLGGLASLVMLRRKKA